MPFPRIKTKQIQKLDAVLAMVKSIDKRISYDTQSRIRLQIELILLHQLLGCIGNLYVKMFPFVLAKVNSQLKHEYELKLPPMEAT